MPEKSRLMPISYYNPKQEIRLSAYADTIVLEPDGREQRLRAIRFGGYPEMVRAMSDAIYAGATLETEFAGETAMLTCEPKKYECHLSHDGIYAEATILSLDDEDAAAKKDEEAQADGQTNVELPPWKCVLFCPAGDRRALFEALDRKTAVPLIPEFQDYVLDELQRRRFLKPLRVISIRERLEAWLLLCKKGDANIVKVLEDGLKTGAIRIPGTVQNPHGFDDVHSVTSYLSAFGVTVAERIREQFQPLFDPAAEQLSPEILRINDYIRAHAGYSLYPAQLAVAESVKRKLSEGKSAFIVAECGSGKTKIGATALAAYQAQKRKKTFNIILCPSHVAKKWVRELAETLPDTAGVIVRSITELDSLYAQYWQGDKSIYAVISKEKARDGYMRRPAVLFDARKGAFRCPGCGSIIELPSSDDTYDWTPAKPEAFRMENRRNHQCMNCGEPLWTAVNPSVPSPWVKIPEYGWVHRKLAVHAMQKTKNPAALDVLLSLHENPDGYFPTRGACRKLAAGMQVLIVNPSLVETGLDLNAFTTLVFYSMGYKLFTLRQASRRSWRINQKAPAVKVYMLYYEDTMQQKCLKLMASKLAVAGLIEGNFSEEGLAAMSDVQDMTSQMAKELMLGIRDNVEDIAAAFKKMAFENPDREVPTPPVVAETTLPLESTPAMIEQPKRVLTADQEEKLQAAMVQLEQQKAKRTKKTQQVENQLSLFDSVA